MYIIFKVIYNSYIRWRIYGGPLGHGPSLANKIVFFTIGKIWKTWFDPPFVCALVASNNLALPLLEILNTPLATIFILHFLTSSTSIMLKSILKSEQ